MSEDSYVNDEDNTSMGGRSKKGKMSNGHKLNCKCPICKNMRKKKGGADEEADEEADEDLEEGGAPLLVEDRTIKDTPLGEEEITKEETIAAAGGRKKRNNKRKTKKNKKAKKSSKRRSRRRRSSRRN